MKRIVKRPEETREAFIARVADAAPPLTPELAARLAALLPAPRSAVTVRQGGETDAA